MHLVALRAAAVALFRPLVGIAVLGYGAELGARLINGGVKQSQKPTT